MKFHSGTVSFWVALAMTVSSTTVHVAGANTVVVANDEHNNALPTTTRMLSPKKGKSGSGNAVRILYLRLFGVIACRKLHLT